MYIIGSVTKAKPGTPYGPGKLLMSTSPRVFSTNYDAVQEACRLAQANPDKEIFVFKAVAQASVTPPPPPPVEVKEL